MRAIFRDWFSTMLIIAVFAVVGVVALSYQVQEYRDQQASDAALGKPTLGGNPPISQYR